MFKALARIAGGMCSPPTIERATASMSVVKWSGPIVVIGFGSTGVGGLLLWGSQESFAVVAEEECEAGEVGLQGGEVVGLVADEAVQ